MRTKSFSIEIVALLVLILIPWPGPTVFKISCPRDSARIVRKLIQKKWLPVLEKRSVKLGMECPFHPSRDIFGTQQAAKQQHRASQWSCAFCGKSFYTERHLDAHFDSRHRNSINMAEDAVCLADYCDVMRCEVLAAREAASGPGLGGTDVEVWRSQAAHAAHRTALSVSSPRDLARVAAFPTLKAPVGAQSRAHHKHHQQQHQQTPRCSPAPVPGGSRGGGASKDRNGDAGDANATGDPCGKAGEAGKEQPADLVDSSLPPQNAGLSATQRMQRFKADCKPEELQKLKTRCEMLVRDCIAGLLVNLSVQDFKEIEDELNRASCWYLTCDRYWEDSPPEARASPWALLALMAGMLVVGVVVCYYIIWVLFDSQEPWCDSPNAACHGQHRGLGLGADPGYHGHALGHGHGPPDTYYHGELDTSAHDDQYIYVTYPPDLKRRLLERPPAPSHPGATSTSASQQAMMTTPMSMSASHLHHHHHHYPVHPSGLGQMHVSSSSPPGGHVPHLSHVSQMSHMQHLAQMPRASSVGGVGQHGHGQHGHGQHTHHPKQDPFEREWRI